MSAWSLHTYVLVSLAQYYFGVDGVDFYKERGNAS